MDILSFIGLNHVIMRANSICTRNHTLLTLLNSLLAYYTLQSIYKSCLSCSNLLYSLIKCTLNIKCTYICVPI